MYDLFTYLDDADQITISKKTLQKLLDTARSRARFALLDEVKQKLGFSSNLSFDYVPGIVKEWREKAEAMEKSNNG